MVAISIEDLAQMEEGALARQGGFNRNSQIANTDINILDVSSEDDGDNFFASRIEKGIEKMNHNINHRTRGQRRRTVEVDEYLFSKPFIVSIGPYNRNHENPTELQNYMETIKWRCLKYLFHRLPDDSMRITFFKEFLNLEEDAWNLYKEKIISMSKYDFMELLLLDACFIILFLVSHQTQEGTFGYESLTTNTEEDPFKLFSMEERCYIDCDVFMIDNQIPLFIIGNIWRWLKTAGVLDGIEDRIGEIFHLDGIENGASTTLLDVQHSKIANVVPTPTDDDDLIDGDDNLVRVNDSLIWIPSVSQLEKVGVKFDSTSYDLRWEIEFNKGVLKIPYIFTGSSWKYLLSNYVEYERKYRNPEEQKTIGVVRFMRHLLKTTEDVRILWKSRTIDSEQGSAEDILKFFHINNIAGVKVLPYNFKRKVSEDVNEYYNNCLKKRKFWNAVMKHQLRENPWVAVTIISGLVLFLVSFAGLGLEIYNTVSPN